VRAYLKTAAMTAAAVGDSPLFVLDYALRLLRVLVLLGLWRTILSANPRPDVMPLAAVLTYTLIAEAFNDQLAVQTTIVDAFWEGNVVLRFLRPLGLVRQFVAEMAGRWAVNFCLFSIPLLLLAPLLGVDPRPVSPQAGALFIVSLGLGILVGLAIEFLFATLTVAFDQPVWLVQEVRVAVATLLSGSLLPLAFYPWGIGDLFGWLPFAAMAWAPLAVFTGTGDPLQLIGLQVVWSVVLWPLAGWLWQANRENVVGFGG
jgi:viologen exporter family transport system permease protein